MRLTLRWRITIWFLLLSGILLGGFSAALYLMTRAALLERVDEELRGFARTLAMRTELDEGRLLFEPPEVRAVSASPEGTERFGAVFSHPRGAFLGFLGAEKGEEVKEEVRILRHLLEAVGFGKDKAPDTGEERALSLEGPEGESYRLFTTVFRVAEESWGWKGPGMEEREIQQHSEMILVATAAELDEVQEALTGLIAVLLSVAPAALIVAALCAVFLARRIARPVAAIARSAESIGAAELDRRVPLTGSGDEVDRLAETLNATFERLGEAFDRQTRFTSDASHELRTPVAVIRTQAETVLSREREPAAYREALGDIVAAADRLGRMLEGLLFLARADRRKLEASFEDVDPGEIIRETVVRFEAEAGRRNVALRAEAPSSESLGGDRVLLSMLLDNLVSNALRHCRDGGEVTVGLRTGEGATVLFVSDQGEGVPAGSEEKIFERFFRADDARSRREGGGGAGLGLAIAKTIAEVHSAEIRAVNRPGEGLTIEVAFPG
jgi:signal transduction histidine kinase